MGSWQPSDPPHTYIFCSFFKKKKVICVWSFFFSSLEVFNFAQIVLTFCWGMGSRKLPVYWHPCVWFSPFVLFEAREVDAWGSGGGNKPPRNTLPLSIECNRNIKFVSLAFSLLSSLSVCFFFYFYLRVWLFGTIMVTVTDVNCIWLVLAAACLIQAHFKLTSLHLKMVHVTTQRTVISFFSLNYK